MEKYAILEEDLISGLRSEEHDLMRKISSYMGMQEKTAQQEADFRSTMSRLQTVRDKITDHDLKRIKE